MPADPAFAGRVYPPTGPHLVERDALRRFAAAVAAQAPACFDPAAARALGHPDLVAAPTFAVVIAQPAEAQYVRDPAAGIDFGRVVHAAQSLRHHRPIVAGDRLWAALTVESVARRRGLTLVTTKVDLDDAAGRPVATVASTLAVRPPDQLAGVADRPGPAAAPRSPRRDRLSDAVAASGPGAPAPTPATVATAQTGDKIGSFAGALARADLARYASASGDFNPIHLDEAAARAAGLPGLIAHGMLTMGRAIQPVVDWAGADPGAVRDYSARFAHPAPVPALGGAELTIAGRVAAAEADAVTVELTVAVAGRKVLAQARAVVRRPGR